MIEEGECGHVCCVVGVRVAGGSVVEVVAAQVVVTAAAA